MVNLDHIRTTLPPGWSLRVSTLRVTVALTRVRLAFTHDVYGFFFTICYDTFSTFAALLDGERGVLEAYPMTDVPLIIRQRILAYEEMVYAPS